MRLFTCLLFILIQFSNAFFSQSIKKIEGFPIDNNSTENKTDYIYIIGKTTESFYLISRSADMSYYILQLDLNMKFQKIVPLDLNFKNEKMSFERVVIHNNKLVLFTSFFNKKLGKFFIFSSTVDPTSLAPNQDLKKILEINKFNQNVISDVKFEYSNDKSKLLVYTFLESKKDVFDLLSFAVVDSDLNSIYKKESIEMKSVNDVESGAIDNQGNAYFIGTNADDMTLYGSPRVKFKPKNIYLIDMFKKWNTSIKGNNKKSIYSYYLLNYMASGNDTIMRLSNKKKIQLYDLSIDIVNDSLINFYGTIEKTQEIADIGADKTNLIGLLQYVYNPTQKQLKSDTLFFDNYFVTSGWNNKHNNLASKIHYYVHPIQFNGQGDRYVLIEEYYYNESGQSDGTVSITSTFYDLIYIHVDANGKMDWFNKITKYQPGYSPSVPVFNNNLLGLYYTNFPSITSTELHGTFYSELTKNGPVNTTKIEILNFPSRDYLLKSRYFDSNGILYLLGSSGGILPRSHKYVISSFKD